MNMLCPVDSKLQFAHPALKIGTPSKNTAGHEWATALSATFTFSATGSNHAAPLGIGGPELGTGAGSDYCDGGFEVDAELLVDEFVI